MKNSTVKIFYNITNSAGEAVNVDSIKIYGSNRIEVTSSFGGIIVYAEQNGRLIFSQENINLLAIYDLKCLQEIISTQI